MLFTTDSTIKARRRLLQELDDGTLTRTQVFERALELDRFDALALLWMADERRAAGDPADAASLLWRAVEADACHYAAWYRLYTVLEGESEALRDGILELGIRKTLRSPEGKAEAKEASGGKLESAGLPDTEEALEIVATQLREKRRDEPAEVSARLLPYRLVDEVLDAAGGLDDNLVDEIVKEGARCGPLLAGVLRAMASGSLPKDDPDPPVAALALLGEIGDPAALPMLIECCTDGNEEMREAALWAVSRTGARRPDESLAAAREFAFSGGAQERLSAAFAISHMPFHAGQEELLTSLLDGLSGLSKADRHRVFMSVALALLTVKGPAGGTLVWELFDRNARLLPKRTKQELRDVVSLRDKLADDATDYGADLTVYDFCRGVEDEDEEEDGEDSLAEDEDEDNVEEEDFSPEPLRRPVNLGRNDPCWCGSGKKYKKCHLASNEEAGPPRAAPEARSGGRSAKEESLRGRLLSFAAETLSKREMEAALETFAGPFPPRPDDQTSELLFLDWLIHDYVSPRLGRTVIEEFLKRAPGGFTAHQRKMLDDWSRSLYSFFEVQDITPDSGVQVKDLFTGRECFVYDVNSSREMKRWDCALARFEETEGRVMFNGASLILPRRIVDPLKAWAVAAREESGLGWGAFLHGNSHKLRQEALRLMQEDRGPMRVVSFEGDELVFSKARYQILDEDALRSALDASPALSPEEDTGEYAWLGDEEEGGARRSLGHLKIHGGQLTLECSTRQRLERGKQLLRELADAALRHIADDFTSWQAALRDRPPSVRTPKGSGLPPEVERQLVSQTLARHYRKWPDEPLPALDGKTPRQAVATAEGRVQVLDILKMIDNHEARNRREGRAWYDVSALKKELGVAF